LISLKRTEHKLVRFDGEIVDVETKSLPTIHEGEPAIYSIAKDVTEKKKTQELMQSSEKLAAVGQLAAGIAHEIRNPITAIKGFYDLIRAGYNDKQEYYDIISTELERIELILSELLILAKPQAVKFQRFDLETLLRHVITLMGTRAILDNIEIVMDFQDKPLFIDCNGNQVKQVFINFLKNAIEAMPNGGKIMIHVGRQGKERAFIRVIDQGMGIPEDKLQNLSRPFFTTTEEGTGLGLTICHEIMKNHQGTIAIQSEVNHGTTIEVSLPLCRSK
jgi:two-component system sporulation sensor kinase A